MANNPQNSYTELIYRVGTFFLLVGIGLVILFVLSEAAQTTTFEYFCWGMILLVVGFLFRAQYRKAAPPPSGRFSILQKLKRKPKEDKAKK
jgi:uncharacterized membrane protein HdeD (DUF308 family)